MEIEIRLPYPERIINKIKQAVKEKEDKEKREELVRNKRQKEHDLFLKNNPLFKRLEKLCGFSLLFGAIGILLTAFGEYYLPENIKSAIMPYHTSIFYIGLVSYLLPFFIVLLNNVLASYFKNKKILLFKKKR